ncbi:hypothetical protein NNRS527_02111 [Nitrosospira sp. NRS527]|nr:hypothetical protein NNRS527_02111 [Nitrosospira sp. NRS527]
MPNPLFMALGIQTTNTLVRTQLDCYIMPLYINNLYNSKYAMDFPVIHV